MGEVMFTEPPDSETLPLTTIEPMISKEPEETETFEIMLLGETRDREPPDTRIAETSTETPEEINEK